MIWIIQMGRPFVERTVWCNIFCCSLTILNWWVLKQLCMKPTCSDQPILFIWPNFEGILCNLDDVVHMNRGLPDEWRSFSPLTSNITSHLWDCSKDCPHLHSLHFVIHQKRKKWFFSVNVNIPKIPLTSEEYNKLISAVFLNIVQKAFDPPPLSFEHMGHSGEYGNRRHLGTWKN